MTIFLLVVLRAIWRFVSPPPRLPAGTLQLLRWLSHAGHAALYLLMLAVPMLGMSLTWASGHDLSFWGLTRIPAPVDLTGDKGTLRNLHGLAADTLLWLAGFHAAAALTHQYVFKDSLLDRMLPARLRASRTGKIAI
jgi:cytochrome b561